MSTWVEQLMPLIESRRDHVVVTLTALRGSAPQVIGAKMIITSEGLFWGTVGGGKIEAHAIQYAQKLLQNLDDSAMQTWNLQKDIGMSCGGEVSLFFDGHYFSNWVVAIFGAGHVAQELCRVMQTWPCRIKIFDTRPEWLEKLPQAVNIEKKLSSNLAAEVASLPKNTYLLSLTQGHATDLPVLTEALNRHEDFAFLGVIGSHVKAGKIKMELRIAGVSDLAIERLVCPVGLPIGNNTPPEISISIAAQLISLRTPNDSLARRLT